MFSEAVSGSEAHEQPRSEERGGGHAYYFIEFPSLRALELGCFVHAACRDPDDSTGLACPGVLGLQWGSLF